MLRVDITKQLGEFSLQATFTSQGRVTGLFGVSGAGKTSLINIIAGLLPPDRGVIALDDEVLDDTDKGVHVPAHRRRIGYVFQDARLFPHLNVGQNLDYGRRMNRLPDDPAQRSASPTCLTSAACWSAAPENSPAANANAWRSAARCCQSRGCSCSTNRSVRSMRGAKWKSCPI